MTDKILYDGFLKIREIDHNGHKLEVMDRGDSVNVMLVIMGKKKKDDIHIRGVQYRAGANARINTNVAGMVDPEETSIQAAIREVREESGYTISKDNLYLLSSCYNSPGACTERTYHFVAVVNGAEKSEPTDLEENVVFTKAVFSKHAIFASMPMTLTNLLYATRRKYIKKAMKERGII